MKTLITGRYVIGNDGSKNVIYKDGCVLYEKDTILYVGPKIETEDYQTIETGNSIVSPGFVDVDALADIDHAILDSYNPPELMSGLNWSEAYFHSQRIAKFSREEEYLRRKYAFVQLLMNGITTVVPIAGEYQQVWAETYEDAENMARLAAELGLRAYIGPSFRAGVPVTNGRGEYDVLWDEKEGFHGLDEAVRFIKDFDGHANDRIRGILLPARIETCSSALLNRIRMNSEELNALVRLHACQTDDEIRLIRKWYNKTPLQVLQEHQLLNPNLLLPHATHIGSRHPTLNQIPDELPLLGDNGVHVVHCPVIEARYGAVLNTFEDYQNAGVNICMGTDTFPPDMMRVMDLAHNLNKVLKFRQDSLGVDKVFEAATLNGAKALGRDDLGVLKVGAKADMIAVGLDNFYTGTQEDPIRTLVLNTTGRDVHKVIINGELVMSDGKIEGVDLAELKQAGQQYFDKLRQEYTHRDYKNRPPEELFPATYESN